MQGPALREARALKGDAVVGVVLSDAYGERSEDGGGDAVAVCAAGGRLAADVDGAQGGDPCAQSVPTMAACAEAARVVQEDFHLLRDPRKADEDPWLIPSFAQPVQRRLAHARTHARTRETR